MHQAQKYIENTLRPLAPANKLTNVSLGAAQATSLQLALKKDAEGYLYSGVVSIGDAVQALERTMYTWATVKLYYALFYLLRNILAERGIVLFYDGTKPFSWSCKAGQMPVKRDGPTHKVVLKTFREVCPNSILISQPIGSSDALSWMMRLREEANYTNAKFTEPLPPSHFLKVSEQGIRRTISAYSKDDSFLYAFDPEHAILALPIEALKEALSFLSAKGEEIAEDERRYLAGLYFDKAGPLSEMVSLINP
ncbi:hypothetical protein ABFV51_01750 [Pseudomonas asgharzadehiana]|uniref:hypothetical protein n=1 Tax=Pseudomonas asgharzadehiana TaxID=2842349 RepID=UPI0034D5598A